MSKAERTRADIIKAAAAAVRSQGPDRVTVATIMARLKLTVGGFYMHFSSKDELIALAIDSAFADITARVTEVIEGKPPVEALASCIDWYVSAEMRDGPERACPLTTSAGDARRFPDAGRLRLSLGAERMAARVEGLLRDVGRPHPEMESMSVVAEMVGAVGLARAVADPARSDLLLRSSREALKRRLGLPLD